MTASASQTIYEPPALAYISPTLAAWVTPLPFNKHAGVLWMYVRATLRLKVEMTWQIVAQPDPPAQQHTFIYYSVSEDLCKDVK